LSSATGFARVPATSSGRIVFCTSSWVDLVVWPRPRRGRPYPTRVVPRLFFYSFQAVDLVWLLTAPSSTSCRANSRRDLRCCPQALRKGGLPNPPPSPPQCVCFDMSAEAPLAFLLFVCPVGLFAPPLPLDLEILWCASAGRAERGRAPPQPPQALLHPARPRPGQLIKGSTLHGFPLALDRRFLFGFESRVHWIAGCCNPLAERGPQGSTKSRLLRDSGRPSRKHCVCGTSRRSRLIALLGQRARSGPERSFRSGGLQPMGTKFEISKRSCGFEPNSGGGRPASASPPGSVIHALVFP
jgi:hypothetical protein